MVPPAGHVAQVTGVEGVISVIERSLGTRRGKSEVPGCRLSKRNAEEMVGVSACELGGPGGALDLANPWHRHTGTCQAVKHALSHKLMNQYSAGKLSTGCF